VGVLDVHTFSRTHTRAAVDLNVNLFAFCCGQRCYYEESTPLIQASSWGYGAVVDYLLSAGANVNQANGPVSSSSTSSCCCSSSSSSTFTQ
jgi:hypothetical protein